MLILNQWNHSSDDSVKDRLRIQVCILSYLTFLKKLISDQCNRVGFQCLNMNKILHELKRLQMEELQRMDDLHDQLAKKEEELKSAKQVIEN